MESIPGRDAGGAGQPDAATVRISVVVPVYNAAGSIGACLDALVRQTVPATGYQVIVVDDGSQDDTGEVVGRFPVVLLRQKHGGAAAARNLGLGQAAGEIVLFTDADCVPAADWIGQMSAPFDDPVVAGVKGVYTTRQRGLVPRFVQAEYEEKYTRMAGFPTIDFVDTYSAGYRRSVLLSVGGFDTHLPGAIVEDQELSFRVAEAGHHLLFVPGAVVSHQHAATLGAYFRRKFAIGYWKVAVHQRHPGKLLSDSHTPQSLRVQIVLAGLLLAFLAGWALGLAAGWLPVAAAGLFLLSTAPFAARTWREDRVVALASPALLLCRSLALGTGFAAGLGSRVADGALVKRAMDVAGALAGLALSAPLMLILAVVIRLDSPGSPVIGLQRVGKDRRLFRMYKLRSMFDGSEGLWSMSAQGNGNGRKALKQPDDPRITRVGKLLRHFSLDELPQFFNVLKGDMSLVGPRPEVPQLAEECYADWHWEKFRVRPGLTGPMQVNGRGELDLDERARLELEYLDKRCLLHDLSILARTFPAVFSGRGSY